MNIEDQIKKLKRSLCCLKAKVNGDIPQYVNNTAALAGGLQIGDLYHLPYDGGTDTMSLQVVTSGIGATPPPGGGGGEIGGLV